MEVAVFDASLSLPLLALAQLDDRVTTWGVSGLGLWGRRDGAGAAAWPWSRASERQADQRRRGGRRAATRCAQRACGARRREEGGAVRRSAGLGGRRAAARRGGGSVGRAGDWPTALRVPSSD